MSLFPVTENNVYFNARAKYIPMLDGSLKLSQIQYFNKPRFRKGGWEEMDSTADRDLDIVVGACGEGPISEALEGASDANIVRASRRAKINAFDTIMCNPSLDTFCTFTYAPRDGLNKASYDECYSDLRPWLSNRVQRNGLQYIIVPERHKSGDIHFHGIMNSRALELVRAHSPKTGRALSRNGSPIYNIPAWRFGFSTAQKIGGGADDREKVSKYVFKYMGKQLGERIGGRYALIGGKGLLRPYYLYADTVEELENGATAVYSKSVSVSDGLEYREYSYL